MTELLIPNRADRPPREDLAREAPFALRAEAGEESDGRTLDGWGAVFSRETIIDSWEGRFREKLSPGSMKKSFRESPPRVQFDHGHHPLVGSIPIARLRSIAEESDPEFAPDGGAHVIARLHDNWLVEPVRDAIASGAIDGMSFRFTVMDEKWFDADGKPIRDEDTLQDALRRTWFEDVPDHELLLRDLKQVRVAEVGPVVWPAYTDTSVSVRSKTVTIDLGRLSDPEQRKTLARAVFLAEAVERMTTDDSPRPTDDADPAPAGEHETPVQEDEPRATEAESPAGEHPSTAPEDVPETSPEPTRSAMTFVESADWYLPATDTELL